MKPSFARLLTPLILAAATTGLVPPAQGIPITGGISFAGAYTPNTGDLNTATAFGSFTNVFVTGTTGSFTGIALFSPGSVTMTPYAFSPTAGGGATTLWSTTSGGVASFSLTQITSINHAPNDMLAIAATGVFHVTGFDDTSGGYILTANQAGGTFSFSSGNGTLPTRLPDTVTVRVPDVGPTALLLGVSLLGLIAVKRRKISARHWIFSRPARTHGSA